LVRRIVVVASIVAVIAVVTVTQSGGFGLFGERRVRLVVPGRPPQKR
jgi:hypothetical protein